MKKYVMLFTFTFMAIAIVLFAGDTCKKSLIKVSVVKIVPITAENSVTCNGKVERAQTKNVYVHTPSLVKEIYVSPGDQVKRGQTIMTVTTVASTAPEEDAAGQTYNSILDSYYGQVESGIPAGLLGDGAVSSEPAEKTITAPTDGEVASVFVEEQGYADPNSPAVTIASVPDLQIRLSVNESQISDIQVGQRSLITGVGFKNSSYGGSVKSISSEAKQLVSVTGQETVVEVILSVENPNEDIKPGFTAKAKIITSQDSNVLIAPYEAVRADENGNEYVYKLDGKKAVRAPVTTSTEFENGFQVTAGLNKNDSIIINPDAVSDGAYVIPEPVRESGADQ